MRWLVGNRTRHLPQGKRSYLPQACGEPAPYPQLPGSKGSDQPPALWPRWEPCVQGAGPAGLLGGQPNHPPSLLPLKKGAEPGLVSRDDSDSHTVSSLASRGGSPWARAGQGRPRGDWHRGRDGQVPASRGSQRSLQDLSCRFLGVSPTKPKQQWTRWRVFLGQGPGKLKPPALALALEACTPPTNTHSCTHVTLTQTHGYCT